LSVNTPLNPELYVLSGYEAENKKDGDNYWSYENGARKCIAMKRLVNVKSLKDFKEFVRYNDYKNDECQKLDPGQAIASRYD